MLKNGVIMIKSGVTMLQKGVIEKSEKRLPVPGGNDILTKFSREGTKYARQNN
jgi:hypothetical protein